MADLGWGASGDIGSALAQQFVEGEVWPVGRAAFAAFIDLGMTDQRIAEYFSVAAADVADLRRRYELVS